MTSARHHRRKGYPRHVRTFGMQTQSQHLTDPYGGMSKMAAQQLWQQMLGPMSTFLGIGAPAGSNKATKQQNRLDQATGPLGDVLRQFRGFETSIIPSAEQIGTQTAAQGSAAYQTLTSQIMDAMSQLPELQQVMGQALAGGQQGQELSSRYAEQAFSPVTGEDLYQGAARRLIQSMRPGEAARGMTGGAGQQAETDALSNLALQQGQNQNAMQQFALQQLGGASSNLAGLTGQAQQLGQAGVGLAGQQMQAVSQLAQFLQQAYGIPMEAMGGIISMLMGGMQPAQNLVTQTAPITLSSGHGMNIL
jgi:hypothetical protein